MAEREGFEPSRRFPAYTLSRRAPSTTRPPLRRADKTISAACAQGRGGAGRAAAAAAASAAWCPQRDSNSRPPDYKSDALPAELWGRGHALRGYAARRGRMASPHSGSRSRRRGPGGRREFAEPPGVRASALDPSAPPSHSAPSINARKGRSCSRLRSIKGTVTERVTVYKQKHRISL
jgi:hypothetical protein